VLYLVGTYLRRRTSGKPRGLNFYSWRKKHQVETSPKKATKVSRPREEEEINNAHDNEATDDGGATAETGARKRSEGVKKVLMQKLVCKHKGLIPDPNVKACQPI